MKIGGVVENTGLTMYRIDAITDRPGSAGAILRLFAENNISLQFITESSTTDGTAVMALCVNTSETGKIDRLIAEEKDLVGQIKIKKVEGVSILGIYVPHFREKPVLAAKFCKILGEAGTNILGLASSISSINSVILSEELDVARQALLSEFELP